jgi:hypothetical protein
MPGAIVYTVGHSTRSIEEFLAAALPRHRPTRRCPLDSAVGTPSAVRGCRPLVVAAGGWHRLPALSGPWWLEKAANEFDEHGVATPILSRLRRPHADARLRGGLRGFAGVRERGSDGSDVRGSALVAMPPAPDCRCAGVARRRGQTHHVTVDDISARTLALRAHRWRPRDLPLSKNGVIGELGIWEMGPITQLSIFPIPHHF